MKKCSQKTIGGFTLLEFLVATTMGFVLLGLLFFMIVPGMRTYALGQIRTEIQMEALRVVHSITSDLDLSVASGISLFTIGSDPETGPVYLGIMRISNIESDGTQHWDQSLIVYSWAGNGSPVVRKVWTPTSPPALGITLTTPARFSRSILSQIANEPFLKGQTLARDVSELRITCSTGGGSYVSPPFTVRIHIVREGATGRTTPEEFKFVRTIGLRNELN